MSNHNKSALKATTIAALGVVYGDIGTSPLYTFRECLLSISGSETSKIAILGFLSLIFWLLVLTVTIKYIYFVMRADNGGEGGVLTLMTLSLKNSPNRKIPALILIGLVGGGFFYGDGVITPAMSVLSAIEGLETITADFSKYIIPISIAVLTLLFIIQKHGSGIVGKIFSPIMIVWFLCLGMMGVNGIFKDPEVIHAINPYYAIVFFATYKKVSFIALGMVVLCVTGVEALYADMGHFGKKPIQIAWFILVMPALVLNYFGQGALVLSNPRAIENPFFLLAPSWAIIPLLILATLATVIASQAVISGVFSLTSQAVRQGYFPPIKIVHTSDHESGQIYIPSVNWFLYIAVLIVIITFRKSGNLAAAYGIAVTGTMALTSILFFVVARYNWKWGKAYTILLLAGMLLIDIPLFLSNILKVFTGGWLPLMIGSMMLSVMFIWKSEKTKLVKRLKNNPEGLMSLIDSLEQNPLIRIKGTSVFMVRVSGATPLVMLHNLKHNKVLHERVIFLHVVTSDTPYVHNVKRINVEKLSSSFWMVTAFYGWREIPDVLDIMHRCGLEGLHMLINETSFFISRDSLIMNKRPWYMKVRGAIFIAFQKNTVRTPDLFKIPPNRVVELGSQVEF